MWTFALLCTICSPTALRIFWDKGTACRAWSLRARAQDPQWYKIAEQRIGLDGRTGMRLSLRENDGDAGVLGRFKATFVTEFGAAAVARMTGLVVVVVAVVRVVVVVGGGGENGGCTLSAN